MMGITKQIQLAHPLISFFFAEFNLHKILDINIKNHFFESH
jgi:hypothetical protein